MGTAGAARTKKKIPPVSDHFVELPLTRLHYIQCGQGPPMIMLPATVSEIKNWVGLAQLMGQYFTTYFFELPGHGESTPFAEDFSSQQLAETLGHLMDALGHERASLMGFSFGGILTLRALAHLRERIDRVVLISPATSYRTLHFSRLRLNLLRLLIYVLDRPSVFRLAVRLAHSDTFSVPFAKLIARAGRVEDSIRLKERLKHLQGHTLSTLLKQMNEILYTDEVDFGAPLSQSLFFAMSINDPLIDYHGTLANLEKIFSNIEVETLTHHYHQAPGNPTFEELDAEYGPRLDEALKS